MRRQKGFTLIELLIVVAIIGIIAAIAIPNLLNAINRGRQRRSMADIRSIATALEAYSVDFNYYPKVSLTDVAVSNLVTYLEPTYIKKLPTNDGWNRDILVINDANGTSYTLYSRGRNGTKETWGTGGAKTSFDDDIVMANGQFFQWPEGQQI